MDVSAQVELAREHLLLDARWYGTAAMRLQPVADPSIKTARTDGTVMQYNPDYWASLPPRQQKTVWAHEAMHCTMRHLWRCKGMDLPTANQAADYAVNYILKQDPTMELPEGALYDSNYGDGWDFERIYAHLRHKQQQEQPKGGQGGSGQGKPQPGTPNGQPGMGDFEQGPTDAKADSGKQTEGDWALYSEQVTAMMQKAGKVPGGVAQALAAAKMPVQDWREVLSPWITNCIPSDVSWARPNKRYMSAGIYLPGVVRENVGPIVVAIDTSGSVTTAMLNAMATELEAIMRDARPESLRVICCDAAVRSDQRFEPDDEIKLQAVGRGGTRFQPVFDAVEAGDEEPLCLIYMTDLEASDRAREPGYPVLFVTPGHIQQQPPFGDVLRMTV